MELINIYYYTFILIFIISFLSIIFIVKNVVKNEKNRKLYEGNMKKGDKVYLPVISNTIEGKIDSIVGEKVIIKIEVDKGRVYPKNK